MRWRVQKEEKKKGVIVKLDFEKAYNKTNWDFLEYIMARKGFGFKWRLWTQRCLSTAHYSVLLNGSPKGLFPATRGLWQEDPLSSFLFTLDADSLNQIISNAETRSILEGFQEGPEKVKVSHLQFADENLLLMKPEHRNIRIHKSLIRYFELVSGLKVNWNKTHMLAISISESACSHLANMLGCAFKVWPSEYLDLPLGGSPRQKEFWLPVLDRRKQKKVSESKLLIVWR